MRRGLVPFFWKKPLKELPATFNARAETVAEKPMFRDAFKRRRCIIPVSGFFSGQGRRGTRHPPVRSGRRLALVGFAGYGATGGIPRPATTCASGWMTPYQDRMPVLLTTQDFTTWLDGSTGADALKPAHESALREWPVSKRVNQAGVGDDDPRLLRQPPKPLIDIVLW